MSGCYYELVACICSVYFQGREDGVDTVRHNTHTHTHTHTHTCAFIVLVRQVKL